VNVVTYRDKDGKVHKRTSSQKVRASFKGGTARATVKVAGAGKIGAAFAAMARDITTEESLTPVLAVLSGVIAYDYEETLTDEKGNLIQVFASAPSPNTPITDAWVFQTVPSWASITPNGIRRQVGTRLLTKPLAATRRAARSPGL
jgi:hypothetical protein